MNDGMTSVFFENLGGMKIAKDFIEVMCKFLGIKDGERE